MRRFLLLTFVIASVLVVSSCGGGGMGNSVAPSAMQMKSGNWVLAGTSATGVLAPVHLGMGVSQSSSTLALNLVPLGPCLPAAPPPVITATMTGSTLKIVATMGDAMLNVTLTGTPTQLIGQYAITGGCSDGDHGTMTATYVPPVTGTWTGTLQSALGASTGIQFTVSPVQSDSSLFGIYMISGTGQITGSPCMSAATIGNGIPQGPSLLALPSLATADSVSMNLNAGGQIVTMSGLLEGPGYDKTMRAFVLSSTCSDIAGVTVLTRQ